MVRVGNARNIIDRFNFFLASFNQVDARAFASIKRFIHQLFGHVLGARVLDELAHGDFKHRAQGVDHGVEDDFRHQSPHEVLG